MEFAWKDGRDQLTSRDVLVVDEAGLAVGQQSPHVSQVILAYHVLRRQHVRPIPAAVPVS